MFGGGDRFYLKFWVTVSVTAQNFHAADSLNVRTQ